MNLISIHELRRYEQFKTPNLKFEISNLMHLRRCEQIGF